MCAKRQTPESKITLQSILTCLYCGHEHPVTMPGFCLYFYECPACRRHKRDHLVSVASALLAER